MDKKENIWADKDLSTTFGIKPDWFRKLLIALIIASGIVGYIAILKLKGFF